MSENTDSATDCKVVPFNKKLSLCSISFLDRQRWRWRANKDDRMGSSAKLVLDALVMHINCKYEECFPSQELLAEETALSENSIRAALRTLKDCGWIDWRRASRPGHRTFFVYRMIWDANPQIAPVGQIYQGPVDPSEIASSDDVEAAPNPSNSDAQIPQDLSPNTQREITKDTSLSSASPTKESEPPIEKKRSPSAEPLQYETVEWWQDRIWNLTGPRFKAKFYPTISMSAFKKRLGETLRRQAWDIPTVDRAICQAIEAEPGCDAWQYVAGILRRKAEAGPDYSKQPTVRGVM